MADMKALIVSLKFNPGHFSHLIANYKLLEELGYTSYLYVNPEFNKFDEQNNYSKINKFAELDSYQDIGVIVFWFPSFRNITEIIKARFSTKAKIIYFFHEPFESISAYRKAGFKIAKIFKIIAATIVNNVTAMLSDEVILPSSKAFNIYQKRYAFFNRSYHCMPLLFDDEAEHIKLEESSKKYISYIGTVAADHAFTNFVDFAVKYLEGNLPEYNFLIATSSIIPPTEKAKLTKYLTGNRIKIFEGRPMKNEEINNHYLKSIVIWNAYNRTMQSGVLPKAYMFGAAVLALRKNDNDFVIDQTTGIIIDDNKDFFEIKQAVGHILARKEMYFCNSRDKFLSTFYYKKHILEFNNIIQGIANNI